MSFPDHLIALQNKSVDASVTTEPTATAAVRAGAGVAVTSDDKVDPGHQIAVLLYSDDFSQRTDAATRFMRAYLRAARFYNDALKDGKLAGPNATEVIDIITEYTPLKNRAVLAAITPTGCNPTGHVNAESLQRDLDFYHARGLVPTMPKLHDMIDERFINAAAGARP
jgi:NitT/TauT family transport system substrate-binding protein